MGKQIKNVHDEQIGKPFVMSEDFVQSIDQKICERWCFTISEVSRELA
jgi:hypothetical protein